MPDSFLPMEKIGRKTAISTEFLSQVGNGIVRNDSPFQGHKIVFRRKVYEVPKEDHLFPFL
jgi:hypothetical protein